MKFVHIITNRLFLPLGVGNLGNLRKAKRNKRLTLKRLGDFIQFSRKLDQNSESLFCLFGRQRKRYGADIK